MANPVDQRESFPTTENTGSGAGVPLTSVQPGSASAGVNGAVGFSFQDSNGNVILPQLNNLGQLPVTLSTSGQRARAHGRVAGAILSATGSVYSNFQTVLSIPLTASASLGDFAGKVSSRRGAYFEMAYQDAGGSLVVLDSSVLDSGQYTAQLGLGPSEDTFVVPASASSPALIVRAGNFDHVSDLHSTLAVTTFSGVFLD